ncbi:MAG: hypothetical protein HYS06_01550 [Methylocystis sp.]|nr:hypothetical protein [Methylocystis sp.]
MDRPFSGEISVSDGYFYRQPFFMASRSYLLFNFNILEKLFYRHGPKLADGKAKIDPEATHAIPSDLPSD